MTAAPCVSPFSRAGWISALNRRFAAPLAVVAVGLSTAVSTGPASADTGRSGAAGHANATRTKVSISAAPTVPVARIDARVRVTGSITGNAGASRVTLQRLHGRTWRTVAAAKVAKHRYAVPVPTGSAGMFTYRVGTLPGRGVPPVTSRPFSFAVGRGNPAAVGYLTNPPARWNPCAPIRYRVNLAGAPKGAAADIDRSIQQVAAASGLRFVRAGTSKVVPGSQGRDVLDDYDRNTELVIAYVAPGKGKGHSAYLPSRSQAVGVGGAFYTNATTKVRGAAWHQIVQGYLVLDRTKKLPGGFGAGHRYGLVGTWGQVIMHELGHVAGLDHPRPSDPAQIMYPSTTSKPAVWGAGDLVALRRVGAVSGCLSTPGVAGAAGAQGAEVSAPSLRGHDGLGRFDASPLNHRR